MTTGHLWGSGVDVRFFFSIICHERYFFPGIYLHAFFLSKSVCRTFFLKSPITQKSNGRPLKSLEEQVQYKTRCYTVGEMSEDVVRMETGRPTKRVFEIVVRYALRFKDSINYLFSLETKTNYLHHPVLPECYRLH